MARSETVRALDRDYVGLTGEFLFLYLTEPGGGETAKFSFHSGTVAGQKAAEGYMRWALMEARRLRGAGRTPEEIHRSIVADGVHAEEGRYRYSDV